MGNGFLMARPTVAEDVLLLAERMRACDRAELVASGAGDVLRVLRESVATSAECHSFFVGDELAAIVGVAHKNMLARVGVPWALGTDVMDDHPRLVLACTRLMLLRWRNDYDCLNNWVHAENTRSIRWLRWAGFVVEPAVTLATGAQFCRFGCRFEGDV